MNVYEEFCTGCGLCHSVKGISFKEDEKGFLYPYNLSKSDIEFCDKICPMGRNGIDFKKDGLWGNAIGIYKGWSLNKDIRFKAASGGVITSIAVYLLETGKVDAIIQVGCKTGIPYETETTCSYSSKEVINNCGSRYSQSNPLMNLNMLVKQELKYAFIGKPCDVAALSNYIEYTGNYKNQIICQLSFFCAGVPSRDANINLLNHLGCTKEKCISLNYRGNGWPGFTKAIDSEGNEYFANYKTSWVDILGRDIRRSCKFCFDGIGEHADISVGDLWNLNDSNTPDFTESDGVNIIFGRTELGNSILTEMANKNLIHIIDSSLEQESISFSQPNHNLKRTTILGKYIGLKFCFRNTPKFKIKNMFSYAGKSNKRILFYAFKGTVSREIKTMLKNIINQKY